MFVFVVAVFAAARSLGFWQAIQPASQPEAVIWLITNNHRETYNLHRTNYNTFSLLVVAALDLLHRELSRIEQHIKPNNKPNETR